MKHKKYFLEAIFTKWEIPYSIFKIGIIFFLILTYFLFKTNHNIMATIVLIPTIISSLVLMKAMVEGLEYEEKEKVNIKK